MSRLLGFRLFYALLHRFSDVTRRGRMRRFEDFLRRDPGAGPPRILDLGGQPEIWENVRRPCDVTLLNLPGAFHPPGPTRHRFTWVEGDACDVRQFGDRQFDVVFSNSVIEHVGGPDRQAAFAREVRRLGRRYWVQTPSKYFPVEAHCGMPFWWFYPESVRRFFIARWRAKLPEWTEMVEGTTVLTRDWLRALFPGARVRTERVLALPKSYVAHT